MSKKQRRHILGAAVKSVASGLWSTAARRRPSMPRWRLASLETLEVRQLLSVPAAPSNLAVYPWDVQSLFMEWSDNSSNETGFTIEAATDPNFSYDVATTNVRAMTIS